MRLYKKRSNVSILDNARVLITGANGFLGHHVVKVLEKYRKDSKTDFTILTPTHREFDLLANDISMRRYLTHCSPSIVIHLAAQCGGIGINREKPGEFLYNNLMMTTNLIRWCSQLNDEHFTGVTINKFVGKYFEQTFWRHITRLKFNIYQYKITSRQDSCGKR